MLIGKMKYLIIFTILINHSLFGQKSDSSYIDKMNNKPIIDCSHYTKYYSNGHISYDGYVTKKYYNKNYYVLLPIGLVNTYYRNGQLKVSSLYNKSNLIESSTVYYKNGKMKVSVVYDMSSETKASHTISGMVWFQSKYNEKKYYRKTGTLKVEGQKNDGKKNGEWIYYDKKGNIIRKEVYN
jgi:antitoxin component YwqK of YwqJK toxin-antitoxin module